MTRKNKIRPQSRPSGFKKGLEAITAQAGLQKLPTPALVATIDTMIGILHDRGILIRDWDEKDKVVQKIRCIGGKVYILAPSEKTRQ